MGAEQSTNQSIGAVGIRPGSIDISALPLPSENLERLALALKKKTFFGPVVDRIDDATYAQGSFDSIVQAMSKSPLAEKLAEAKVRERFAAFHAVPLLLMRQNGAIVIGINADQARHDLDKMRALKVYMQQTFKENFERIRLLVLSADDFMQLGEFAYNAELRSRHLKELNPDIVADKLFLAIVERAIQLRASDIHIEPQADESTRVRFRIDGSLQNAMQNIVGDNAKRIVNVIKIKSKVDFDEHRIGQDGSIFFTEQDMCVGKSTGMSAQRRSALEGNSLRVSVLPSIHGEEVVIRILKATSSSQYRLARLGLNNEHLDIIQHEISNPAGVIIVSGPTGSGKTTTLYAVLQELNKIYNKIVSIEDPVESQIDGITQCQASKAFGFAAALRSFMRADPDVILIGEIRDEETAKVAVQASMTGHLVFSTIHTESAISAINRLMQSFGIDPVEIQNSLVAVVAQRLVRRVCEQCVELYDARAELNDLFSSELFKINSPCAYTNPCDDPDAVLMYKAPEVANKDCAHCGGLNYRGQAPVIEIWQIGAEEKDLITQEVLDYTQYLDLALKKGFKPLAMNGLHLALSGITTLSELKERVFSGSHLRAYTKQYAEFILQNRQKLEVKRLEEDEEQAPESNSQAANS